MNEDASGYGNRSRKPSGYCKLTMPNKVSCYVQGLRQLSKGQMYRLYLTSKSKQQSVEVGMLQVGASGNKETRWVMNPTSINNSGVKAQDIDGAFIVVNGDGIKGQVVPLVGFSSEPYIWEHLVKSNKEIMPQKAVVAKVELPIPPSTTPEEKVEVSQVIETKQVELEAEKIETEEIETKPIFESRPIDKRVEVAATRVEAEPAKVFCEAAHENQDQAISDDVLSLKEEVENLKRTIQASKALIEELQRQAIKTEERSDSAPIEPIEPLEKASGINDYINNFIRKFQEAGSDEVRNDYVGIGEIYEKRIPINPFEAQNTGIKWVRITHDDLTSFSSLDNEWINQPLVMDAHRDYKHFILGRDEASTTYYLGIPGVFDPNRQSGLEIDKIERFSCCNNVPARAGEAGYWIAMV